MILAVFGALAAGSWWYLFAGTSNKSRFRTAAAERGELLATINATGTIEAEEVIDIGAQVQGKIEKFGPDPRDSKKTIDYGSEVEEDTVLAQIDPSLYKATVDQTTAICTRPNPTSRRPKPTWSP
jgi:HlyD family secretion protein